MIKLIYALLSLNNVIKEPFDTAHMTFNLYDEATDTAFIFDGVTEPYKDCGRVCVIHTKDDEPSRVFYDYYPQEESVTDAAAFLKTLGYQIAALPASVEDAEAFYDKDMSSTNDRYRRAIIRYMESRDCTGFPVNGYEGLILENWFRMQPNGYLIPYQYCGKECFLINDTWAWGDWGKHFSLLQRCIAEHGTARLALSEFVTNGVDIAPWVQEQRTAHAKGYLKPEREQLLVKVGLSFNTYDDAWERNFALLQDYQKETGSTDIAKRASYHGVRLGLWAQHQRDDYKQGIISQGHADRLSALCFDWDPLETEWNRRYEQYKRYISANNGNPHISRRTDFEGEHLGAWVESQRKRYSSGKLSNERAEQLKQLGMELSTTE